MKKMTEMGKRNNRKGFTLFETLAVVLIISLLALSVGGSVTVIQNVYQKTILKANAQMLLSTTAAELSDELRYATGVSSYENDVVYEDGSTEIWFRFVEGSSEEDKAHVIQKQACSYVPGSDSIDGCDLKVSAKGDADKKANLYDLTSEGLTVDGKMYITYSGITYDKTSNTFTVSGLQVRTADDDDKALTEEMTLKVRRLNDSEN